jgi:hypothetical protein
MKKNKIKLIVPAFILGFFCVFNVPGDDDRDDRSKLSVPEELNNQDEEIAEDEFLLINERNDQNDQMEALTNQAAFLDFKIRRLSDDQTAYNDKLSKITIALTAAVSICLIAVILSVFELLLLMRLNKSGRGLKERLKKITDEFESYRGAVNRELKSLTTGMGASIRPVVSDGQEQLKKIETRLAVLEDGFRSRKTEEAKARKEQEEIARGMLDPVTLYNNWAAYPASRLPQTFYYLKGEMRIRTTQPVVESVSETRWITNRYGDKKYLFPNPNSFDQMTDISELYRMEMDMLKPRGQNKIKIIEPCEMSNAGFINYPGELTIL